MENKKKTLFVDDNPISIKVKKKKNKQDEEKILSTLLTMYDFNPFSSCRTSYKVCGKIHSVKLTSY